MNSKEKLKQFKVHELKINLQAIVELAISCTVANVKSANVKSTLRNVTHTLDIVWIVKFDTKMSYEF